MKRVDADRENDWPLLLVCQDLHLLKRGGERKTRPEPAQNHDVAVLPKIMSNPSCNANANLVVVHQADQTPPSPSPHLDRVAGRCEIGVAMPCHWVERCGAVVPRLQEQVAINGVRDIANHRWVLWGCGIRFLEEVPPCMYVVSSRGSTGRLRRLLLVTAASSSTFFSEHAHAR